MNYPQSMYGTQFQGQPDFQCCQSSLQFRNSSNPFEYPYQCQFMRPHPYYPTHQCQPQSMHYLYRHQCPHARMRRMQCTCQSKQKNMNEQANAACPFKAKNQGKTQPGTETCYKTCTIDKAAFPMSDSPAAPASTPTQNSTSLPMLPRDSTNSSSLESTSAHRKIATRSSKILATSDSFKNSPQARSPVSKYSLLSEMAPVPRETPAQTPTSRYPPIPARAQASRHSLSPATTQVSRNSTSPEKTPSPRNPLSPGPGRISRYPTPELASRNFRSSVPDQASKYLLAPVSAPVARSSSTLAPKQTSRNFSRPASETVSTNPMRDSAYTPAKYTRSPPPDPCDELMLTGSDYLCLLERMFHNMRLFTYLVRIGFANNSLSVTTESKRE